MNHKRSEGMEKRKTNLAALCVVYDELDELRVIGERIFIHTVYIHI